jgi:hypothetical protein
MHTGAAVEKTSNERSSGRHLFCDAAMKRARLAQSNRQMPAGCRNSAQINSEQTVVTISNDRVQLVHRMVR